MYNIVRQYAYFYNVQKYIQYIRCYSAARKNHYEVLRLQRNCSDKDIKEAFIKLSKEYHPDKNKSADAQQQFVKIVEAYNVLGKTSSRAQYDSTSRYTHHTPHYTNYTSYAYKTYDMYNMKNTHSPPHNKHNQGFKRQESQNTNYQAQDIPYYGVRGIHKVPHYVLIMICIGVALVGTVMQGVVIRNMYSVNRRKAMERDQYLSKELEKVRTAAKENSNERHTQILMEKIVGSSNPTIATASLGQALATEKK